MCWSGSRQSIPTDKWSALSVTATLTVLITNREKMERYYRQQERAVAQIAIKNIRWAKQRELLEHCCDDLVALDQRLPLVPDVTLVGTAVIVTREGDNQCKGEL